MIWWIALIGSIAMLALIVPYGVLLFAEAAGEARSAKGSRPCPHTHRTEDIPARLPTARLTRREYRRICKVQEAYRVRRPVML